MMERLPIHVGVAQAASLTTEQLPLNQLQLNETSGVFDRLRNKWTAALTAGAVATASIAGMTLEDQPAYAVNTEYAVVGMPFGGKWAYSGLVNPNSSGAYDDATSSHPSVHGNYSADWGTDIYAGPGTEARLEVGDVSGSASYTVSSVTNTSCGAGKRVRVNIKVDGTDVGWVQYEHLDTNLASGTALQADSVLGKTKNWGNLSCYRVSSNTGVHLHVGMKNIQDMHSCYATHGRPGEYSLTAGIPLGILGSSSPGIKQACTAIPNGATPEAPPPPPQLQSSSTVSHNSALHIFARGQDHELYDKAYNASSWNSLQRIQPGSLFEAGPTAVQYAGELHLLGRGINNEFYKNTLTSVGWTGFVRLEPGALFAGDPVAVPRGLDLHIFGRGVDNQLYDKLWAGTAWNGIQPVAPGSVFESDPTVISAADGLHIFARGLDDEIHENTLLATGWTGFQRLQPGSIFEGDPTAVEYAGELHLVARGIDDELYKNTRTSTGWTGFSRLEPGALFESDPSMAALNGNLHIIARGTNDELYDKAYNGTTWNSLQRLAPGSIFENDPVATAYAGELHLTARGIDDELYKNTLTSVGWTGFQRLERGGVFEGE